MLPADGLLTQIFNLLAQASPLILAALGGLISEYAGLLNIGIEGIMLCGAFAGIYGASLSAEPMTGFLLGIVAAALVGLAIGLLMSLVRLRGGANIFIVGLAINLLATGLVSIAAKTIFGTNSVTVWPHALSPTLSRLSLVSLALLAIVCLWWFMRTTRTGLRLRVLGQEEEMLLARGILTGRLKIRALILSCILASLAGAALSLQLGAFVPNQSAGKGWIALVLVFVGGRHALGVSAACLLFILTENLASAAQAGAANPTLLVGLPFILVLAALMLVQILRKIFKRP